MVMVHADVAIRLVSNSRSKGCVWRDRPDDLDSGFLGAINRRANDLIFLSVAKLSILARVRIETTDGDGGWPSQFSAQRFRGVTNSVLDHLDTQGLGHIGKRDVDGGEAARDFVTRNIMQKSAVCVRSANNSVWPG